MDTLRSFGSKLIDKSEKDHANLLTSPSVTRKPHSMEHPRLAIRRTTLLMVTKEMIQTLSKLTADLWHHGKTDYEVYSVDHLVETLFLVIA